MRKAWRPVTGALTSAACGMLLMATVAHGRPAAAVNEAASDTADPGIRGTSVDPPRLAITAARWPTSALASVVTPQTPAPTRRDSVLDGILIGAGVGALVGLIPDHYDDCKECHDSLYASIGVGAGVGLLVDVLRVKSATASPSGPPRSRLLGVESRSARVRVSGILRWR
jgi:hypothetical protein